MKKVVHACMRLTSDEIAEASRDGRVHFVPQGQGARLVKAEESLPPGHASVRSVTAARRSGIFGPDFPVLTFRDRVERITFGCSGDEYDPRAPEVRRTETSVANLLAEAKRQFTETDRVQAVGELYSGDRMFVRFEGDGELYSITVRDSSVTVPGKDGGAPINAALCDVAYRVPDRTGKFQEKSLLGIMRLPLTVGGRMVFSEMGRPVRELSARPIRGIQLKRSPKRTRK